MTTTKKSSRSPISLHARALVLLARREHSRRELAQKLARHATPDDDVPALLDTLEERKLLSEARFVEARVSTLAKRYGSARITRDLAQRGVTRDATKRAGIVARTTDLARARDVWQRRFGVQPSDALERAKQMRFLATRGFPFEVIQKLIGKGAVAGESDD